MVPRLEALLDAIGKLNGYSDPSSTAYKLRNIGLLRSYSLRTLVNTDKDNVRFFTTHQGGYRAGLSELHDKCSGNTGAKGVARKKLTSNAKIEDLLMSFGIYNSFKNYTETGLEKYNKPVQQVIAFLREALTDPSIDEDTPLLYFLN